MKQKKLVVIVLTLLVVLLLPVIANAGPYSYRRSGKSASAGLQRYDPAACIYTDIAVFPADNFTKEGDQHSTGPTVFVRFHSHNTCTNETYFDGVGLFPLNRSDFTIDSQLQSAQLNTTVEVFDRVTSSNITLDIDLTWTGVGEVESGSAKFKNNLGGCKFTSRYSGTVRQAAVSGSVTYGTTNLLSGLEPYYVEMASNKESYIDFGCGG